MTKEVAEVTMQKAATEVRRDATVADITVSCDGTWQRHGFSSKNGVATVLTVAGNASKVIDTETLQLLPFVCYSQDMNGHRVTSRYV